MASSLIRGRYVNVHRCSDALLVACKALAVRHRTNIHIHLQETLYQKRPLRPRETERRELARALEPHLRRFYAEPIDAVATPHARYNAR